MSELSKPQTKVFVPSNPKIGGYDQAVKAIHGELVDRYGFWDLWLFMPDADRATGLDELEDEMLAKSVSLFACPANPEVEAWLLAGHRDRLDIPWQQIRLHQRLKEDVFEPFLTQYGNSFAAGEGRESLMRETLRNYRGLLEVCPELKTLEFPDCRMDAGARRS